MIDRKGLLANLRRQLKRLEQDLAERAKNVPEMTSILQEEYRAARDAERTGDTFLIWRAGALSQAAVAWLLCCVFVRFAEDNSLVDAALIAGPGERNARAEDRQTLYFRARPTDSDRDYLLDVFAEVARLPGIGRLYDRLHNPVWRYGISGDAARDLLAFWRAVDPDSGALRHDFTDSNWDTRFLGDLYQDLSDEAKKRFALLQTPEFVEEFILDRTLTPALDEFGLPGIRLIDPACGSGHFLLGAFSRLLRAWFNREPGTPERVLVQRALDGVYGVDINPFAAAIAQFRLLVAALRASRVERLQDAPNFRIHVSAGDSLLHGRRFGELDLGSGAEQIAHREGFGHAFLAEDLKELNRILGQQYHVVVGNPPYVTAKDKALNQLYRGRYSTCYRKYALTVPFIERSLDLTQSESSHGTSSGYVGVIVSNSFMTREFGKKLVEEHLSQYDLTHVIDTSGAYIPGHGTPTLIAFMRARMPLREHVRVVMGIKGEPYTPTIPSNGRVWTAIMRQLDTPDSESEWISCNDIPRISLTRHPWSLTGGGADQLKMLIEHNGADTLAQHVDVIGFGAILGEDDAFGVPVEAVQSSKIPHQRRRLVEGDLVRNWSLRSRTTVVFPYSDEINFQPDESMLKWWWPLRTRLWNRTTFGNQPYHEAGRHFGEYHQIPKERNISPLSIAFAFVATHNHFVLDRGDKVFNRTAPVIKLPTYSSESDHLALMGLLNSSIACFWMKQTFFDKGGAGAWERRFEHAGTALLKFPISTSQPLDIATQIDNLCIERENHDPRQLVDQFPMTLATLDAYRDRTSELLMRMITLQEELDWECYRVYRVVDEDCRYVDAAGNPCEPPPLALGERAFEVVMARQLAEGALETTWFTRHGSTPITELPHHWPADYRTLVERRIELIESNRFIGLIERPEYKRRWNVEPWQDQEQRALRNWLLSRLESPTYWPEIRTVSVRTLAERAAADADFQQVAIRYAGHAGVDLDTLVTDLLESESVPALPVQRYGPTGLAKRRDWERTWAQQRNEDDIDAAVIATTPRREDETKDEHATRLQAKQWHRKQKKIGNLTAPPKYRSVDFLKPTYWRLRGALDVPKERFVSFPAMSRDSDPTLLVGWAGWNVLELCQAVATYYAEVIEQDGWPPERLTPLLAVLQENLPWLKQWHNEVDPEYNQRLGYFFETYLHSQLSNLGLTEDDLRTWAPPGMDRRRGTKRGAENADGSTVPGRSLPSTG